MLRQGKISRFSPCKNSSSRSGGSGVSSGCHRTVRWRLRRARLRFTPMPAKLTEPFNFRVLLRKDYALMQSLYSSHSIILDSNRYVPLYSPLTCSFVLMINYHQYIWRIYTAKSICSLLFLSFLCSIGQELSTFCISN